MAQEMLNREVELRSKTFELSVQTQATTNIGAVNSFIQNEAPSMYTTEQVLERASALYAFIDNKRNI